MQRAVVAAVFAAVALLACAGPAAADMHVGIRGTNVGTINSIEFEHYTMNDFVSGPWGPTVRLPYQLSITRVGVRVTVSWVSNVGSTCNNSSAPDVAVTAVQLPQRFRPGAMQRPVYFTNTNGRYQLARLDITPDGWMHLWADLEGRSWTTPGVNNECTIFSWNAAWRNTA